MITREEKILNCFVIMPFAQEFDDVYEAIKRTVELALGSDGSCSRLDEHRPAGPITTRLIGELQSASLCVVDITGLRPNVMWELGYVMALGKPPIIITQDVPPWPFDINHLQILTYDRRSMSKTLGVQLKRMVIDTLAVRPPADTDSERNELIGVLRSELQSVKDMLSDAARWAPPREGVDTPAADDFAALEGAWCNERNTHYYAKVVRGELVVPYCYHGNDQLNGVFFDWKRVGGHWFARFAWLAETYSGFAFLKPESLDTMVGAWWYENEVPSIPKAPPLGSGVAVRWERLRDRDVPQWAREFHDDIREHGLISRLTRRSDNPPEPGER